MDGWPPDPDPRQPNLSMMLVPLCLVLLILSTVAWALEGYDRSTVLFHPSGRLQQLECAKAAVQRKGGRVVALRCVNGILLAAARRRPTSNLALDAPHKTHLVDNGRILIAVSGLLFEAPNIIQFARKKCEEYRAIFSSPIPIEKLCSDIADILHELTRDGRYRPLGISLVVAGQEGDGSHRIITVDPEGSYSAWKATAIGYNNEMVLDDLIGIGSDLDIEAAWDRFLAIAQSGKLINRDTSSGDHSMAFKDWDVEVYSLIAEDGLPGRWSKVDQQDF